MRLLPLTFFVALAIALSAVACAGTSRPSSAKDSETVAKDSLPEADSLSRYSGLTDADFELVAKELNVETAAIKAVVEIEAGKQMKGFYAPGVPVVNFDRTMFGRCRQKAKGGKPDKSAKVPKGLKGYALQEWTQLTNARHINADAANMGTFWGMFQIGGFNYRFCGCETVQEFVDRNSYSELEQLQLFAVFITKGKMLADLQSKNWAGFARKYNGAGYARRGYHTRMAAAYKKYKQQESERNSKKTQQTATKP